MEALGVKFLGTIKDSKSFPFQIVDLNDSPNTVSNGRPVVQGYGTRTSFTARSGDKVASVMRHGAGKVPAARAATSLVECRQDTWAYETESILTRSPHGKVPPPLQANANIDKQVDHAWKVFMSRVTALTLFQRTADWFLARYFRFTSTTLHVVLNVKAAVYINTDHLRSLHLRTHDIICLNPRKTITVQNTSNLDGEDLLTQCGNLFNQEGEGDLCTNIGNKKCAVDH